MIIAVPPASDILKCILEATSPRTGRIRLPVPATQDGLKLLRDGQAARDERFTDEAHVSVVASHLGPSSVGEHEPAKDVCVAPVPLFHALAKIPHEARRLVDNLEYVLRALRHIRQDRGRG